MRARLLVVVAVACAVALAPTQGFGASRQVARGGTVVKDAVAAATVPDGTVTVNVPTSLELDADILVRLPITVVCKDHAGATASSDSVNAPIEQAHGSTIGFGTAQLFGGFGSPLVLTCDGTTVNTLHLNIFADASRSPFRNGSAILTVQVGRSDSSGSFAAIVGPEVIQLKG